MRRLVRWQSVPDNFVPFDESDLHDPGLEPFPASRPATTDAAKRDGQAIGVAAKPAGNNRRLQPVTNKFFYWLRASRLETHRLSYWWAQRMLVTPRPLQEKLLWVVAVAGSVFIIVEARRLRQKLASWYADEGYRPRSKRSWRCSGTAISPPARRRYATTARCCGRTCCFARRATAVFAN